MGWDGPSKGSIKLKLISFFVARYLTELPSGSSANLTARRFAPSLMGWDGMGWGVMGDQKCPLIFFILRYIKHYTYTNLYIYKKCPEKFLVGLKIWTSWGPDEKIQKHPVGMIFSKMVPNFTILEGIFET